MPEIADPETDDSLVELPAKKNSGVSRKSASSATNGVSKTVINFVIDLALLVLFSALGAVAAVVQFVFPTGTTAAGWTVWGFSYDAWSRFQFGLLSVLALGILVHVMMHWTWVCGVVVGKILRRKEQLANMDDGIRTLYGVTTLIVVFVAIGAVVAAANLSIHAPK